ncbi:MAG: tryptophan-rich sensory protein [Anaerolineae bacterium]|nr:tryptophan-rich sensory protein [Anaerolineae bacterium]
MNKDVIRQVVVVLALVVVLVVNGLANALPLNGLSTGEISDRFDIYFVLAGYVFSIWGVIYLALIGFAVYQALPSQRENPRLRAMGYPFALSCLANSVWIFLWHYLVFPLTLVAMLVLLGTLIFIYLRLEIGCGRVSAAETWLARVPFSLYLGWITVATIANVTQLLYYLGWGGWGIAPEVWAVIMLVVGSAVAGLVALTRGDVAYMLVIVWAFVGIAVKHAGTPLVSATAWAMAGVAVVMLAAGFVLARRGRLLFARP